MSDVAVRGQEEIGLAELRQRLPELKEKADLVREFQKMVLREGVDYGPIPGTGDRDVLLKPGAESLIAWHNFDSPDPEIEKEEHDWATGFHYYVVRRTVRSSRGKVFTSLRACSSFEKKYRYDRVGNERPVADLNSQSDNVLAMADKRALVAVTRLATATSGLFDEEYDEEKEEAAAPGLRVPFGNSKGKLVSELTDKKDISWLADAVAKSLTDPAKSRYKPQNERLHAALVARLAELSAPPKEEASATAPPAEGLDPSWHDKLQVEVTAVQQERDPKKLVLSGLLSAMGLKTLADVPSQAEGVRLFAEYLKRTGKGQEKML